MVTDKCSVLAFALPFWFSYSNTYYIYILHHHVVTLFTCPPCSFLGEPIEERSVEGFNTKSNME